MPSEWPPRAKKFWLTSTTGTPNTSANTSQTVCSAPSDGGWAVDSWVSVGSAFRSSLPLGVNGRASTIRNPAGSMWRGNDSAAYWRRAAGVSVVVAGTT